MIAVSLIINITLLLLLVGYSTTGFQNVRISEIKSRYYILACLIFLFVNKLPVLLQNRAIDPDEAFNLAEGMALIHVDPVLWRSIDFFTIGPIHIYHFIIPHLLGFAGDYANARLVWFVITLFTSFFIFKALGYAYQSAVRNIAFLYPFLFYAFGNSSSFNSFNNEATSNLLLAAGILILFKKMKDRDQGFTLDGLFYFLLGMVPYCKLQSAPLAVAMVLCFFIIRIEEFKTKEAGYIFKAFLSGMLPSLVLGIYLLCYGQMNNFLNFYLISNLGYGQDFPIISKIITTFLVRSVSDMPINYFLKHVYVLVFVLILVLAFVRKFKDKIINIMLFLFVVTMYSVAKPGFNYGHYFTYLYITLPFGLAILWKEVQNLQKNKRYFFIVPHVVLIIILSFYNLRLYIFHGAYDKLPEQIAHFRSTEVEKSEAAKDLIFLKNQLDHQPTMTIFDWYPQIYIESGIFQGTHQNIPERLFGFQASEKEVTDFSRKVFLEDLKKNRPEFILVAITTDRSYYDYRYSNFHLLPEIKAYFDANYFFYRTSDNTDIFIRNDLRSRLKL
jgi:hypothetical protein